MAAASGEAELQKQLEQQMTSFKPPHPEHSMVSEAELKGASGSVLEKTGLVGDIREEDAVEKQGVYSGAFNAGSQEKMEVMQAANA